MNETTLSTLRRARTLLSNRTSWTKHENARNAQDHMCAAIAPAARSWCAIGALLRSSEGLKQCEDAFAVLENLLDGAQLVDWNDAPERRHSEVLALFDRAIRILERE